MTDPVMEQPKEIGDGIMSKKSLEVLQMIIDDMGADVKHFDGKPFNGKTMAEIHGTLAATIQALAKILKKHIDDDHGTA